MTLPPISLKPFLAAPRRASGPGVVVLLFALGSLALASMSSATTLWSQELRADVSLTTAGPDRAALALTASETACPGMTFDNVLVLEAPGPLDGTPENDLLVGSDGDDRIRGFAGDDCILAGDGSDLCSGGEGDNLIFDCEPYPGPQGLDASFEEEGEIITLEWERSDFADSYLVFVSIDGEDYEPLDRTNGPSFEDRSVQRGSTYRYYVIAADADGFWSLPSDDVAVGVPERKEPEDTDPPSNEITTIDDTQNDPPPPEGDPPPVDPPPVDPEPEPEPVPEPEPEPEPEAEREHGP
jgi:Ca2+-binding RTX toxin-like protein